MNWKVAVIRGVICTIPLLLSGCWDRVEINDAALVAGTAIDKVDDHYRVSLQIPLPGQMGGAGSSGGGGGTSGSGPWQMEVMEGKTIMEANQFQQQAVSRMLNFSHRRIVLFGEDVAKEGLSVPLDVLVRVPQNRLSTLAAITKGEAGDVLAADAPYEQLPAEMAREIAQQNMRGLPSLRSFASTLLTEGIDPILPYLALEKASPGGGEKEKTTIKLEGMAIFDDSKMTGIVRGNQVTALLLTSNRAVTPTIRLPAPRGTGYLEVRLQEPQTELTPTIKNGQISVKLKLTARGWVADNESKYDISAKGNLQEVEKHLRDLLRAEIDELLHSLQTRYHSDPLGIGNLINQRENNLWKEIKKDWKEIHYPKVKTDIVVHVHLEHTGAITKPIGWMEGELIR